MSGVRHVEGSLGSVVFHLFKTRTFHPMQICRCVGGLFVLVSADDVVASSGNLFFRKDMQNLEEIERTARPPRR